MCYPVCWMVHIKEPLLLIGKSIHIDLAAGFFFFLFFYLNCPLPYVLQINCVDCILQVVHVLAKHKGHLLMFPF